MASLHSFWQTFELSWKPVENIHIHSNGWRRHRRDFNFSTWKLGLDSYWFIKFYQNNTANVGKCSTMLILRSRQLEPSILKRIERLFHSWTSFLKLIDSSNTKPFETKINRSIHKTPILQLWMKIFYKTPLKSIIFFQVCYFWHHLRRLWMSSQPRGITL